MLYTLARNVDMMSSYDQGVYVVQMGNYSVMNHLILGLHVTSLFSNLRVRSFGVIRVRVSDPGSVWIMVHQRNQRIESMARVDSPVPLMHHDPDRSRQILDH